MTRSHGLVASVLHIGYIIYIPHVRILTYIPLTAGDQTPADLGILSTQPIRPTLSSCTEVCPCFADLYCDTYILLLFQ